MTTEQLRDIVVEAWKDGWRARRSLIGRPAGTVAFEYGRLLAKFLESVGLPPVPPPPTVTVREAIIRLAEEGKKEQG